MTISCKSIILVYTICFWAAVSVYKVGLHNVNPLSNESFSCWRWYRENKSNENQIKFYSILSLQEYQNSFNYSFTLMKLSVVHIMQVNQAAFSIWSSLTNQNKLPAWCSRKHYRSGYSPSSIGNLYGLISFPCMEYISRAEGC